MSCRSDLLGNHRALAVKAQKAQFLCPADRTYWETVPQVTVKPNDTLCFYVLQIGPTGKPYPIFVLTAHGF